MNQSLSRREMQIVVILPAVLIACLYVFVFERPHRAIIDDLQKATATARGTPIDEDQLRSAREHTFLLSEQIKLEQRRAIAATRSSLILPKRWTTPAGRLDALAFLSGVCDAHDLFIVSSSRVPDTPTNAMAPKPLQDFAAAVATEGHSPVPEVWHVEVLGTYADVLSALRELEQGNAFIVPLGISMENIGPETSYRHWSLWLWV